MLTVVAALIQSSGKVLVCQRRRTDSFSLMWEFPGGKVEPEETPAQGLARELQEELGVTAEIGCELFRAKHRYAELSEPIELIFLSASLDPDAIQNLAFEKMEWRAPESLSELNFLPADREFVTMVARDGFAHSESK